MTNTSDLLSLPLSETEGFSFVHVPVLCQELIDGLQIYPGGHYLDATIGGGSHSQLILSTFPNTTVTGIDRDETAMAAVHNRLASFLPGRLQLWQGNFADFPTNPAMFEGIIADLGVSSPQLDASERGFSFRQPAPLDMRMDRRQSLSAAEIVNQWQETQLANLIYQYGEERLSRRIARQIVQKRPFQTTTQLAEAIAQSVPAKYRYGRIHPATRTFQALRIAVNQELDALQQFLEKAPHWLKAGGIIGIISFHSLEDRLVKYAFRDSPTLTVLTKKPIVPSVEEQKQNPRSRSAKLRFAQRNTD